MAFNSTYIESFQTKHRSSVGFTSTAKEVPNESNALINPHAVNAAQIPIIDVVGTYGSLVASGVAAGVVQKHTIKLTADPTVNNSMAWYMDESDCIEIGHTDTGKVANIMRVAGTQYKLRLFEDNGAGTAPSTEIFTTEPNFSWDYDASAGTVYMDADPDPSKVLPLWAEVYVYIGETVSDKLDTTSSGSVGDNYYTKSEADVLLASNSSGDRSYADSGDSSTLGSAQSYADGVGTSANSYTDTQLALQDTFIEMGDTPAGYDDTKLVLSTGAAIVYTSDLTWNDTINALTITSGTFGFSDKGTTVNEISTDTALTGASDDAIPTEAAVKSYVDTQISTGTTDLDFYKTISDGVDSFDAAGNDDTLTFNGAGGIVVSAASGTQTVTISGAADFIGLTDTPSSYISSNAGYMVRVNDAYDGLDFESTIITDASGNTTIYGDLSVSGTVFYVDHETVQVTDNMITVNYGEVGVGVTNIYGGIEVDRGTLENYWFVFDETDDWFKIGTSGTLQPVATRGSSLTEHYIAFGNDDSSYTESSDFTYNDTTKVLNINGSATLSDGTNGAPAYSFTNDTDTGMYLSAAGFLGFAAAGSSVFNVSNTGLRMLMAGSAAIPAIRVNETDTGFYYEDPNILGVATSGTLRATFSDNGFTLQNGIAIREFSTDGTLSGNSDTVVPTEKAVKTYVDTEISTVSGVLQAGIDAKDEFIELIDTPSVFVDNNLLVSTTSGIEFTSDVTFDGSTFGVTGDMTATGAVSGDTLSVSSTAIDTSGNISAAGTMGFVAGTTINEFSTDTTLSGNSDDVVPTEAAVKSYVDSGDASTLSSAQSYADGVGTSANNYTDTQLALQDTFVEMGDTPAGYDDTKLVMSTAGAIVYTTDIAWNDSTNALTITSGTFGFSDAGTTINEFSTDTALAGDSDDAVPTEAAVKAYVDAQIASNNSFIELTDTPGAYTAQQMLFTSASGVEFAPELTWNNTSSLMTISGSLTLASGTLADEISNDNTLDNNSSTALVTEFAIKGYVDGEILGQQSYNVNMTLSGTTWVYNGGFTTMPDNLVIYLNGVRNKSNDTEYYTATVNGGILEVEFAYDTFSSDWVTATYGAVQGGVYVARWQPKTDVYQSVNGDRLLVDTSATGSNGVPYTITLPANPTVGDVVYLFDAGGDCATTNVTVGRNGSNIMGAAADMDIDVDEASVELVYYNSAGGWRLV